MTNYEARRNDGIRIVLSTFGATGFEPATCRRGDRSTRMRQVRRGHVRFCNKAPFAPLGDGLQNFRCESGSRERRAWLLSSDWYCDDEDAGEDFRTSQHSGVHFFDFAKHNSGTQR